jgi:hypothetical protein
MVDNVDPRLIRLVQEVDRERKARIAAERRASMLKAVIVKMKRTIDAKPQEPRPSC